MTPARKRYKTAAGESRTWVGYTCPGARYDRSHPKARTIPEVVVEEAVRAKLSGLRLPDLVAVATQAEDARADIDRRRGVIIDAMEAGTIRRDEAEPRLVRLADEAAALEATEVIVDVPELDWSWPAELFNTTLRTLVSRIILDDAMVPVDFESPLPAEYWP